MGRQTDFVLRTMEERDVRFVRLWFTDVLGFLKSVAIAPAELEGAFSEGVGFDGSAIEGYARVYESDMVAHPDPSSFQMLPWRTQSNTARMFCDITLPDGSPSFADPRHVLKRALDKAGLTFTEVDVTEDATALAYVRGLGAQESPVVVLSTGEHWTGFNPDKIKQLKNMEA